MDKGKVPSTVATKFQQLQSDLEELVVARQRLETQLQENKIVMEEFETVKEDTKIYKLTGNVLLPVEREEARGNVVKRLEFINREIERCEKNIKEKQEEINKVRGQLISSSAS